jgi:hypothetical protein
MRKFLRHQIRGLDSLSAILFFTIKFSPRAAEFLMQRLLILR